MVDALLRAALKDEDPLADADETEMDDVVNRKALFTTHDIPTSGVLHMAPFKSMNEDIAAFASKMLTYPVKNAGIKVECTCEGFQWFCKAFHAADAPWSEKPRLRKR